MYVLKKIWSAGEEDGAFEFTNGAVLFWTSGRGGFLVEGGLGFYDPSEDALPSEYREMARAASVAVEAIGGEVEECEVVQLGGLYDLPSELMAKARAAYQSLEPGKYQLSRYLVNN